MTGAPHDPTRAGPPVPAARPDGIIFSLSEIQAECLKAARGSGMPWGLAEEAGMSAAWLTAADLPGPELLLQLLEEPMREAPRVAPGVWRAASGGTLCPILAGAALSDFAALPEGLGARGLTMVDLAFPLLILPFASRAACRTGWTIGLEWSGFNAFLAPDGFRISTSERRTELAPEATAMLARRDKAGSLHALGHDGRCIPLDVWKRLDDLAMKTTVPATQRSHADAGSSASDND